MMPADFRAIPEEMPHFGNPGAPVVVICDHPTIAQWKAGQPIVGRVFDFWAEHSFANGFDGDDFFFVSPCAPIPEQVEGSEAREKAFVDQYREALHETIRRHCTCPRLFVYLGKTAGYALTGKPIKITRQRGVVRAVDGLDYPVLPMFSPQHVLRRPENTEIFEADMNMLRILREGQWQISAAQEAIAQTEYEWRDDISDVLDNRPSAMSLDTEGVGIKWYKEETRILSAQFTYREGHAIVLPLARWENSAFPDISSRKLHRLKEQFRSLAEDPTIKKSAHNMKFDHHALRRAGIEVRGWSVDTQLLAFFADENMQEKSQDECVRRWVSEMAGYADAFNRDPVHRGKSRMDLVPPDQFLQYAGGDADANFRLAKRLMPLIKSDDRTWNAYRRVQWPAMRAFMDVVEPAGILIDRDELTRLQETLSEQAELTYQELIEMVPAAVKRKYLAAAKPRTPMREVLSFSRDQFVRDIMFSRDGFNQKPIVFTPTTRKLAPAEQVASASTKTHLPFFDHLPFVPLLVRHQQIAKLLNTYVGKDAHEDVNARGEPIEVAASGFWKYIDAHGYIHPSFILHRTVTGRTSSQDPNGQNIPKRGPIAKQYRKIFVPRPGYKFVEVDLSQAELRIAAWMANEQTMLRIYQTGGDIHMATAYIVSNLSKEAFDGLPKDLKKEYRQKAKAVNFGFLYGMGWRKFMTYAKTDYGVTFTEAEAKRIRFQFFRTYSGLEPWHTAMREFVREHGYVRALHGAKRNLPNIRSIEEYIRSECERQAINSPVQRFGSDLGLMALGRLCRDVDPNLICPVAFIHDALVCEVREDYVEQGARIIRHYMQSSPLENWFGIVAPLPIVADISIGTNLSDMEERPDLEPLAPACWSWADDGYVEPPELAYEYEVA